MTHKFDGILFSRGREFSFKRPTKMGMKKGIQEAKSIPFFQVCHTTCHTVGHTFYSQFCQIFSDRSSRSSVVDNNNTGRPPVDFFPFFPLWGSLKKRNIRCIQMEEMAYYLTSHLITLQNVAL